MTRGYRPVVAIGEAQRKAAAWGLCVITVETEARLPFDFVVDDRGRTSLVRVRRLKYAGYGTAAIERTCRQQLAELRQLPDLGTIVSDLWVPGPEGFAGTVRGPRAGGNTDMRLPTRKSNGYRPC
jgi:hypothetical protein